MLLQLCIGLLKKYNVLSAITKKQEDIKKAILKSEETKRTQEKKLVQIQEIAARTDEEKEKIIKEGERIAQSLSAKITSDSEKEEIEIKQKAENDVKSHKDATITKLKEATSEAAFLLAQEHVKQALDKKMHKQMIDEFIDNLEDMKV